MNICNCSGGLLAVAIQRACSPGPKCDLAEFLNASVARVSCLPGKAFSGQAFHRVAQQVTDRQLEQVQVAVAKAAVSRFALSANVLAFDTTNFDTHIATLTPGELARRGHAKSKRSDLRVVGLGLLASETGYVPLLYRTYAGNESNQGVLTACLEGLGELHDALDEGEGRKAPAQRTLVRDGGFWSPQLELDLDDIAGYYSLISLPLGHRSAEQALEMAALRGAMKRLGGSRSPVAYHVASSRVGCRRRFGVNISRVPPWATRAVHGSAHLEYRQNRIRLPRPVECRGTLSPSQEGRRSPLGTLVPKGRWFATTAHVRNGARPHPREPRENRIGDRHLGQGHDGKPFRDSCDSAADDDERPRAAAHGHDRSRSHRKTAACCEGIRPGSLVPSTSFMYSGSNESCMK